MFQGYNKELTKILTTAGLLLSNETKKNLIKNIPEKTSESDKTENKFDSLEKCSAVSLLVFCQTLFKKI